VLRQLLETALRARVQRTQHRRIPQQRRQGGRAVRGVPAAHPDLDGAKSGERRENLIGYFDIDDTVYVAGSAAGRDASPGWVFNLRAQPAVTVEIGSDPPRQAVAHELPRAERDRLYGLIVERAPGFGEYEKKTNRVIPVFELTPSS
jgi:deazaflavin-dependent oxidoreductase (nitroreductase family)